MQLETNRIKQRNKTRYNGKSFNNDPTQIAVCLFLAGFSKKKKKEKHNIIYIVLLKCVKKIQKNSKDLHQVVPQSNQHVSDGAFMSVFEGWSAVVSTVPFVLALWVNEFIRSYASVFS